MIFFNRKEQQWAKYVQDYCEAHKNDALNKWQQRDMSRVICLDTETTGLSAESDELLQVSVVDGNGATVWNRYYKPATLTEWPQAEAINHISPEAVANALSIQADIEEIVAIIENAELVIGANTGFDLKFIAAAAGLDGTWQKKLPIYDVIRAYAQYRAVPSEKHPGFKRFPLSQIAQDMGAPAYDAHNSLADAQTTLFCYRRMQEPDFYGVKLKQALEEKRNHKFKVERE